MPVWIDLTADASDSEASTHTVEDTQDSGLQQSRYSIGPTAKSPIRASGTLSEVSSPSATLSSAEDIETCTGPRGTKRKKSDLDKDQVLAPSDEHSIRRVRVQIPPRLYPDSAFERSFRPGEMTEAVALRTLLTLPGLQNQRNDSVDISLDQFCVYWLFKDTRGHGLELPEMVSLQDLPRKPSEAFFFDGYICSGYNRIFVRRARFRQFFIVESENLPAHAIGKDLWIMSDEGSKRKTCYRLGKPAPEYERFHTPFIWTASLTKYVADFLHTHKNVSIHDFRTTFYSWLLEIHGNDHTFQAWFQEYADTDFMSTIAIHRELLQSQIEGLDDTYASHILWSELACKCIPRHPLADGIPETIVTPYVASCFRKSSFKSILKSVENSTSGRRGFVFNFSPQSRFTTTLKSQSSFAGKVCVGDVVAFENDMSAQSSWRKDTEEHWYLLVQSIKTRKQSRSLHGLWLYASSQTILSQATYPYKHELFLSDHCDTLTESDVVGIVAVTFFTCSPTHRSQLFVSRSYDTDDKSFRTLQEADLVCRCHRSTRKEYQVGDTILVRGLTNLLEPVVLQESTCNKQRVSVRKLPRARTVRHTAAANELMLSDDLINIPFGKIERSCRVRIFRNHEAVKSPYSNGGIGNCFFIVHPCTQIKNQDPDAATLLIKQSFAPGSLSPGKLNGMDIFCGSGAFGHGVEASGGIEVKVAVDIDPQALTSYYTNTKNPDQVHFFCGSVDEYLLRALRGRKGAAKQGQIGFIIGGSPCQGFSLMNGNRDDKKSMKNISLVASAASFIEFFRPQYVFLENVIEMASTNKTTGENVFSQLLAAYIGMGYQAQTFNTLACTEGAPQTRPRLIIALTAPGLTLLTPPGVSHHYDGSVRNRALGKAPNGLRFGERDLDGLRAFECVSISEACADLPTNQDGKTPCVRFPDHQPPVYDPYIVRQALACVPRGIPGRKSPATAIAKGLVPQYLMDVLPKFWSRPKNTTMAKAWTRVEGHSIVPTIVATFSPANNKSGQLVHWEEDRPLTIEEVRRAQQFPKQMVLLGRPTKCWHQVGNSVAYGLSLSLGISLREAVDENSRDQQRHGQSQVATYSLQPGTSPLDSEAVISPVQPTSDIRVVVPSISLGEEILRSPVSEKTRRPDHLAQASRTHLRASTGTVQDPSALAARDEDLTTLETQDNTDSDDDVIYILTRSAPSFSPLESHRHGQSRPAKPTPISQHEFVTQSDDELAVIFHPPHPRRQVVGVQLPVHESPTHNTDSDANNLSSIDVNELEAAAQSPGHSSSRMTVELYEEMSLLDEGNGQLLTDMSEALDADSEEGFVMDDFEGTHWVI